ncbi:hypothetical protein MMC30_005144 [Trapelia coarctata]|nr:hypothetical protein [Trapelia coarctata]
MSNKRPEPGPRRAGDAAAGMHNEGESHVFDAAHGAGEGRVINKRGSNPAERILGQDTVERPSSSAVPSSQSTVKAPKPDKENPQGKNKASSQQLLRKQKNTSHTPSASATTSQPVLVNPAPLEPDMPSRATFRRSKAPKASGQFAQEPKHDLPPLSAFSFSEILASIDPDVRSSIDTIAEICGKSKLSLANEYGSHMPPHGDLSGANGQVEREEVHGLGLEVVEEVASDAASAGIGEEEGRKGIWGLFGTKVGAGKAVTGTSDITTTATLGRAESEECLAEVVPSPAVRHLQALTRVS